MKGEIMLTYRAGDVSIDLPGNWEISSRLMPAWRIDGDHQLSVQPDRREGHRVWWRYALTYRSETVFDDADVGTVAGDLDADAFCEAARTVLGFLTLRPGDTDRDYFDGYTPRQTEWMEQNAEDLSMFAMDDVCGYCGSEEHTSPAHA